MLATANLNSNKRKYDSDNVDYVSKSKVEFDTFSILWSIENFSGLSEDVEFKSPVYRGGPRTNHSWQLSVNPNTMDEENPDHQKKYLNVYLILKEIDPLSETSVKACTEFSILNKEGEPAFTRGSKTDEPDVYAKNEDAWGCTNFVSMSKLSSSELVVDDVLKIHCRVWIRLEVEHSSEPGGRVSAPLTQKALDHRVMKQLRLDFKKGFETGAFTDLSLVTKTKTFKTHKFVLAARSPVFQVMLSSGMQEATQNSVEILDFDEETVERLLEFVYSGQTSELLSADQACDLLRIADKYEVLGFKKHLEEVIGNNLDTNNVLKVLATAELHGATKLKTSALHFTNKHKKVLQQTPSFKKLVSAHPNLICELYMLL